jgi:glycosyltransferase involved in cell wall biosynthesis
MQKRALILTYYFPPCNFIGANRPNSWAENFFSHGIHPTIVTRHWEGNEKHWEDNQADNLKEKTEEQHNGYTVIRLPYEKTKFPFRSGLFSKLYHFFVNIKGLVHSEVDARRGFRKFLSEHLKTHQYDYLLVTSPPLNVVRLGSELSKKFGIPLIVDFRDLWDNALLNPSAKISLNRKVLNFIYEFHLRKWLKQASLCVSVSEVLIEQIKRLTGTRMLVVTNGYEKHLFDNVERKEIKKFTISFIGTFYPNQKLDILFDGIRMFLKDKKMEEVVVNFIGTATIPEVRKMIEEALPSEFLNITERVKRSEALSYTLNSHILSHAAWIGFKGIYTSKLFEYLGAGRNILIAPGDKDVIDSVMQETNAGKVADHPEDVRKHLEDWYQEWKQYGELKYDGRKDRIEMHTRENQAKKLAGYILKNL